MFNEAHDLQRTPVFTKWRDEYGKALEIPVPENSILDPVAEYNRGELAAMDAIEEIGFSGARQYAYELIDEQYEKNPDYVQGFNDAVEIIGQQEI